MAKQIYRKKSIERISSPEELNGYLKVTNPGVWLILVAVIAILVGVFVWAVFGTASTLVSATAVVNDGVVTLTPEKTDDAAKNIKEGMDVWIDNYSGQISEVRINDDGETEAILRINMPDGSYGALIVAEEIAPIEFAIDNEGKTLNEVKTLNE